MWNVNSKQYGTAVVTVSSVVTSQFDSLSVIVLDACKSLTNHCSSLKFVLHWLWIQLMMPQHVMNVNKNVQKSPLYIRLGGECIRLLCALGRHVCPRWVQCTVGTLQCAVCRHVSLKSASSCGGSGPHLMHGSFDPHESAPKQHLDRFSHFCTAHPYAQQIDHAACDIVAIGHIHDTAAWSALPSRLRASTDQTNAMVRLWLPCR